LRETLYNATVLSTDLVSFGYILRPVVLPIEPTASGYTLLDIQALRNRGFTLMADWLERAQRIWEERRTEKAEEHFSIILDRLSMVIYSQLKTHIRDMSFCIIQVAPM
jgi:hypothetical protein